MVLGMGATALLHYRGEKTMCNRSLMSTALVAVSLAAGLVASPAAAGNAVSFVSGKGSDGGNSCASQATPCRTFAHALTQTNVNGEIKALDPANYGALTIDRSISVIGVPGASIRVESGNALVVNASKAVVNLRGIEIDGAGVATAGIVAYYARTLNIVDCVVRRFANEGVSINGGWDGMSVTISRTISSNNGLFGIDVVPGQKPVSVAIDHTTTNENSSGVRAYPGATVTVVDSIANRNVGVGYLAVGGGALKPTSMRLSGSVATGNQVGIQNLNAAVVQSSGDNEVFGNVFDISGAVAVIPGK
jgi:hypothetical protein